VSTVESLRIDAIEKLHAPRQVSRWRFDEKVVVVGHQAVGVTDPVESRYHATQDIEEAKTIPICEEDLLSRIAAAGDVVDSALVLNAKRSSHGGASLPDLYSRIKA